MDILILGSGGREHALACALATSSTAGRIFVAPGNGGTAQVATNVALPLTDAAAIAEFSRQQGIGLVVIGPELPLVEGVADELRTAGIDVFGPGAEGARIEGSKRFSKEFMDRHSLPCAKWGSFQRIPDALAFLSAHGAPIVVKADGLAAGKGVTVAASLDEARCAIIDCFSGRFGAAGATVVLEECLSGPECSLLALTDGQRLLPMPFAQDHKRVGVGDTGPNTGGMGATSPAFGISAAEQTAMLEIMERAVAGLAVDHIDYRGVLYGGFMLTESGPKLLEFNARFGDPETQAILPRLQSDLLEVLVAVARGDLGQLQFGFSEDWAVSVVLAASGYPGSYRQGMPISGLEEASALPGVTVYHAGTALAADGSLVTAGGRVLNVTALAPSFEAARTLAYQAVDCIQFEGCFFRPDIGNRTQKDR
ncbi:MAG: phosphoribosylamine--glycine ligase [Actinomycetia bacterium]|nr:phosphoribosylamine--glycine ligase [Actinomycetes bacterium]